MVRISRSSVNKIRRAGTRFTLSWIANARSHQQEQAPKTDRHPTSGPFEGSYESGDERAGRVGMPRGGQRRRMPDCSPYRSVHSDFTRLSKLGTVLTIAVLVHVEFDVCDFRNFHLHQGPFMTDTQDMLIRLLDESAIRDATAGVCGREKSFSCNSRYKGRSPLTATKPPPAASATKPRGGRKKPITATTVSPSTGCDVPGTAGYLRA